MLKSYLHFTKTLKDLISIIIATTPFLSPVRRDNDLSVLVRLLPVVNSTTWRECFIACCCYLEQEEGDGETKAFPRSIDIFFVYLASELA